VHADYCLPAVLLSGLPAAATWPSIRCGGAPERPPAARAPLCRAGQRRRRTVLAAGGPSMAATNCPGLAGSCLAGSRWCSRPACCACWGLRGPRPARFDRHCMLSTGWGLAWWLALASPALLWACSACATGCSGPACCARSCAVWAAVFRCNKGRGCGSVQSVVRAGSRLLGLKSGAARPGPPSGLWLRPAARRASTAACR
jgi:hypothetical protein